MTSHCAGSGPHPADRPAGPFRGRALLSAARRGGSLGQVGLAVAALLIFVWSFAPFLWLVIMSLSPSVDLVRTPPTLIPNALTLENYRFVLFPGGVAGGQSSVQATRVPYSIFNSLVVAVCVTADQPRARLARRLRLRPHGKSAADERHALGADDDPDDAVAWR